MTRVYRYYCIYFTTPQDSRVSVYKSRRNMILHSQEKSKNVNVGIKTQHKFQSWKEDKSSDMDVMNMYKDLSVSIWPQSQITEINLCFKAISWKHFISKSWAIFVLKDNYNRYYHKKTGVLLVLLNVRFFVKEKIALIPRSPPYSPPKKKSRQIERQIRG